MRKFGYIVLIGGSFIFGAKCLKVFMDRLFK